MYWHITLAAEDRLSLFPSDTKRLAAARTIARIGRGSVLLFCAVDDHVHVVVAADRPRAGRIAANVSVGLGALASVPLDGARIRPVRDRRHLRSLVRYVLDQSTHHELQTASHPALWPGSAFRDLVGARLLPGFDPRSLAEALPRLRPEELFGAVGLPLLDPASDDVLADLGIGGLARAAAEVTAGEDLTRRQSNGARALVARLALGFGVPTGRVAAAIGTTGRHVRRLATGTPDAAIEQAIRMWIAVSQAAARGTSGDGRSQST